MDTPAHANRKPLNLAADDLRAAVEFTPIELRVLIDEYRGRVHAQEQRLEEGTYWYLRNPRHHLARNPDHEAKALSRQRNVLHYLLKLHLMLEQTS